MIFRIPALLIALTVHEYAHARTAVAFGDPTPRIAGRVTLNPIAHLDPFGLIMLWIAQFGWAKPVPINPFNFRDQKYGQAKVALAGVAANFALALVFGTILRLWPEISNPVSTGFYALAQEIVVINLVLAVFNLIPIPPLDGSHVLFTLLPASQDDFKIFLQRYGFIFLLILIYFLSPIMDPILQFLYRLIVGVPLV